MKREPKGITIGALADASGVNVETIRFYQRRGLLREPRKPAGGIRRYDASDVARLRFIRIAQRLGFTLDEVDSLLKLHDGTHCAEASDIARHKLAQVQARLADLRRMEVILSELIARCERGRGRVMCPLIQALQGDQGNLQAEVVSASATRSLASDGDQGSGVDKTARKRLRSESRR